MIKRFKRMFEERKAEGILLTEWLGEVRDDQEQKEDLAKRRKLKAETLYDQARQDTCVETAARENSLSKVLMPKRLKIMHVRDLVASSGSTKIGKPMPR